MHLCKLYACERCNFSGKHQNALCAQGSERGWDNQTDAPEEQDDGNLFVDGHNLAAPVFVDVDGDRSKEMIVPVSYFFDTAAAARY